eukprot:m.46477 g.46477  ORF g.46477 m.46477 type:complete len:201 (-) comp15162_c0_seq1:546-1148(-)
MSVSRTICSLSALVGVSLAVAIERDGVVQEKVQYDANISFACQSALSLIEQAEGYRDCTYVDTTGHKTICYGYNLDNGAASKDGIAKVGGNWDTVYDHCACPNGGCLSKAQCVELLSTDVNKAKLAAAEVFGEQCECVQNVLTDMTYNLGKAGISSFGTFVSLIKAHSWSAAADDARRTLWCRQVGSRCTRDADIIAKGC